MAQQFTKKGKLSWESNFEARLAWEGDRRWTGLRENDRAVVEKMVSVRRNAVEFLNTIVEG